MWLAIIGKTPKGQKPQGRQPFLSFTFETAALMQGL
jgi:hypothetical protein